MPWQAVPRYVAVSAAPSAAHQSSTGSRWEQLTRLHVPEISLLREPFTENQTRDSNDLVSQTYPLCAWVLSHRVHALSSKQSWSLPPTEKWLKQSKRWQPTSKSRMQHGSWLVAARALPCKSIFNTTCQGSHCTSRSWPTQRARRRTLLFFTGGPRAFVT